MFNSDANKDNAQQDHKDKAKQLYEDALEYHMKPRPGKLEVCITKSTETARDLSLAYSPGVAEPCRAIFADENAAYGYTNKGNLVGVITDGSAILGLGNLGGLASKPVMEGKGVLFKRFAGIDVFDIEVKTQDPLQFVQTVANIAITFGGINLEDIKAPECFEVERMLKDRCAIPVFHDDQHGTAIIIAAGLLNALELQGKAIQDVVIVCVGAGAAGVASIKLLLQLGAQSKNIYMLDRNGVIHTHRNDLNQYKAAFANDTDKRMLSEVLDGADVFIGVSSANLLGPELLNKMAPKPVIFALANPDPEIRPEFAHQVRDDLIIATGRSDYPNQVNNVLCFPFIFRGALDVRASSIHDSMMIAAVESIRQIAKEEVPVEISQAYEGLSLSFGPEYIIPKPMDPRLIQRVPAAVAQAAVDSGVARLSYPSHYPLHSVKDVFNLGSVNI